MRMPTRVWLSLGFALFACDSGGSADEAAEAKSAEVPAPTQSKTETKAEPAAKEPTEAAETEVAKVPEVPEVAKVEEPSALPEPEDDADDRPTAGAALGSAMAGAMSGTAIAGPFMKTGADDELVSARQTLFVRADGSGDPITGMHLGDPGLVAERLGLLVVPARFGTAMAAKKGAKPTLVLSADKGTASVVIHTKHVTTPAGVAVGMRYDDIVAKVPGAECRAEASADGEFLQCEVDVGVFAAIEAPKGVGDDWDDNVLEPAKAEKLAGKAKVSSLHAWYSDVPEPGTKTEIVTALVDEMGVLPAGVSWNGDTYPVCDSEPTPQRCHRPRAAVVAGVYDLEEATKQLAAVDRTGLAAGYPLVVHTDELELEKVEREGVAIVLGLFARPDAAQAWAKTYSGAEVLTIQAQPTTDDERTRVARLRTGSVKAYASDELGQIDRTNDGGKPVCKLHGDTLVTFGERDGIVYESVPVTCPDGTKAYVRWWDTMVFTTVGEDPKGKPTIWQLVGAECDQPRFAHWRWADNGRAGEPKIVEGDDC